jgi:hypothetical protein
MHRWSVACGAALVALSLAGTARADEWNKLTYLTFSGPVQMPGVSLPAGTYRFELADPDSSRRVVRVSDKDGSKSYGIFLSIPDQKLEPASDPVVMFKETPSGAPAAVQAWFYPGETFGYEFVYPHDQAMKIAKATHGSVLAMKDTPRSSTDADRRSAMTTAEVTRIDENGKPVSTDEALKDSSSRRPSNTTTASNGAAQSSTAQSAAARVSDDARTSTARSTTARQNRRVGTSGTQGGAATDTAPSTASRSPRRLPSTAGELPLYELLSGLALAGGFGIRAFRRR